jgi:hypothetical protein
MLWLLNKVPSTAPLPKILLDCSVQAAGARDPVELGRWPVGAIVGDQKFVIPVMELYPGPAT